MPSKKVQRKFARRGRIKAFAQFAGVSGVTVSLWRRGLRHSPRLDRLAREWKPGAPATVPTRQSAPAPQTPETATTTTAA
jgi:hypothetical protein